MCVNFIICRFFSFDVFVCRPVKLMKLDYFSLVFGYVFASE